MRKRFVKTPKVYMQDSGQACYLAGISEELKLSQSPLLGMLFETWVYSEIRKILIFKPEVTCGFYRTHLGNEVDFLLSAGDIHWGIECKYAETINSKQFKGLKDFQSALNGKGRGLIFYMGDHILSISDSLMSVPLRCLF